MAGGLSRSWEQYPELGCPELLTARFTVRIRAPEPYLKDTRSAYDCRMRLITSDLALSAVLALSQANRATLAELADILGVAPSSCQRALEVLVEDGLVIASGEGRDRRYVLNGGSATLGPVEQLARASISPRDGLRIIGRANPAIEFIGLSTDETVVVFAKRSTDADRDQATGPIRQLTKQLSREPRFFEHADLRRPGMNSAAVRRAVAGQDVLVGSLDRSLPDRTGRRGTAGRPLGSINPDLQLPSRRVLRSIVHRYGVRGLKVFGSAVRTDFRSDSDIDVAVTPEPGRKLDQSALESLETELEERLGRNVDVVLESQLKPGVRYMLEREAVTL